MAKNEQLEETIATTHIHHLLEAKRIERPDLIVAKDDDLELTNESLTRVVDRLAKRLIDSGIQTGERVSYIGPPSVEFLVAYLAILSIGACWLGLNPRYTADELEHILQDGSPSLILLPSEVDPEVLGQLQEATSRVPKNSAIMKLTNFFGVPSDSWTALPADEPSPELVKRRASLEPRSSVALIYTSGTTGEPKGALLSSGALGRLAITQSARWGIQQPRVICNLPINHTGCLGDIVTVSLYANGLLRFVPHFDTDRTIQIMKNDRINGLFQIPTQLIRLADDSEFDFIAENQLKLVAWGGAPLPEPYVRKFRALGVRLQTVYGSSETVASLTSSPDDATDEQLASTVGQPDPEFRMHLRSNDGKMVDFARAAPGATGEVCVKHWTFLPGYLNNPEATEAAFTERGWHRTGDIGRARADGLLELVGRTSDMFKSGGYNVYPREIEKVIDMMSNVKASVVIARPHPEFSEVGCAFIELHQGVDEEDFLSKVRHHCRQRLANYKVPKEFVALQELPLLANGKINKVALRNSLT